MINCDKCGGSITEGSKYCPHCGDPVTELDKPKDAISKNQVAQVEISFGRSTSANYEHAVEICKKIESYKESGEGSSLRHSVTLPITEVDLILNIYELVGSFKSSRMLINGQFAKKSALVYHGVGCFRNQQKAYNKEQYCFGENIYEFNIWGCKRLEMPFSEWGGSWLEYGSLDDNGIWHFDKQRIRHELERSIHENELCPILNRTNIFETLDKIPNTIDPKSNPNWEYKTEDEEIDGDWKEVATGIKPVLKKASTYVIGSYKPKWDVSESKVFGETDTIRISIDTSEISKLAEKDEKKISAPTGCLIIIIVFAIIVLISLF